MEMSYTTMSYPADMLAIAARSNVSVWNVAPLHGFAGLGNISESRLGTG